MATTPRRNLPPEAEPWGRYVDDELRALNGAVNRLAQDNKNAFEQVNSTMRQVSKQLTAISNAQTDLAAKQAVLEDLLETQNVGDASWNSTMNFPLTPTWTNLAACSLTVPAGYTSFSFQAIGSVIARNDTGATNYLYAEVRRQINGAGTIYGSVRSTATVANGFWSSLLVPYNIEETAAPGEVHQFWINVWAGGGTWTADPDHYASIEVFATFRK